MKFLNWFLWGEEVPHASDKALVMVVIIVGLGALILCGGVNAIN